MKNKHYEAGFNGAELSGDDKIALLMLGGLLLAILFGTPIF